MPMAQLCLGGTVLVITMRLLRARVSAPCLPTVHSCPTVTVLWWHNTPMIVQFCETEGYHGSSCAKIKVVLGLGSFPEALA